MSKVTRYKINTEKYLAFLYTYNEKSERETKEIIPITIVRKRIKYIGLNLHEKTQKTYQVFPKSDDRSISIAAGRNV